MTVIDDPQPLRRFGGDEAVEWREAGFYNFVPCVSKDGTIAVIALGRRPQGEPLSSEDIALIGAVAGQAATALENARLYGQLQRQGGRDRAAPAVQRQRRRVAQRRPGRRRSRRPRAALEPARGGRSRGSSAAARWGVASRHCSRSRSSRRCSQCGASRRPARPLYRVPLATGHGDDRKTLLVNLAVAPFQTPDGIAGRAGSSCSRTSPIAPISRSSCGCRRRWPRSACSRPASRTRSTRRSPGSRASRRCCSSGRSPKIRRTQLLEKIERQTFRAAKIVNSLLNLARPSGGETGPVDLNGVIGDVLSLLEHQFSSATCRSGRTSRSRRSSFAASNTSCSRFS